MSLINEVFPHPRSPRWTWIYYTITTPEDFRKAVDQISRPVVLMFSSDSNAACKVMKKPFRDLALDKLKKAVFCLVDIDKLKKENIVEQYRVEALPTIVLLKNGELMMERVVGAKEDDLKTTIGANI